jgi:hypothetical protein
MTSVERERQLQEFRQHLFGSGTDMPSLYLEVLDFSSDGAEVIFGQQIGGSDPRAFWLKGRTLGELSCVGKSNEDAQITGRLHRLSDPVVVEVAIRSDYDDFDREVRWWGRILTLQFAVSQPVTIDATKGDANQRQRVEQFINRLLGKIAGD